MHIIKQSVNKCWEKQLANRKVFVCCFVQAGSYYGLRGRIALRRRSTSFLKTFLLRSNEPMAQCFCTHSSLATSSFSWLWPVMTISYPPSKNYALVSFSISSTIQLISLLLLCSNDFCICFVRREYKKNVFFFKSTNFFAEIFANCYLKIDWIFDLGKVQVTFLLKIRKLFKYFR